MLNKKKFGRKAITFGYGGGANVLSGPPFKALAVQYIKGGTLDRLGSSGSEVGREGVNGAYFDGDGTRYVRLNSAVSYSSEFEIEFNAATINAVGTVAHVLGNVTGNAKVAFLANSDFFVRLFNGGSSDTIANAGSSELKTFKLRRDSSNIVYGTVEGVESTMFGGAPQVGTVTFDTLFASNDSAPFFDKAAYVDLETTRFNFEESNFNTKVIGTGATPVIGEIQNATGADRVSTTALESRADIDGYTESDGASYYYDVGLTQLIPSGVIIPTFNGKAMAYTTGGVLADAEFSGELKANLDYAQGSFEANGSNNNLDVPIASASVPLISGKVWIKPNIVANRVPLELGFGSSVRLGVKLRSDNSVRFQNQSSLSSSKGTYLINQPLFIEFSVTESGALTSNVNGNISTHTFGAMQLDEIDTLRCLSDLNGFERYSGLLYKAEVIYDGSTYAINFDGETEEVVYTIDGVIQSPPTIQGTVTSGQWGATGALQNLTTKYSVVEADKLTTVQMYDHTDPDAVVPWVVPVDSLLANDSNVRYVDIESNEVKSLTTYSEAVII